jgi:hypothetical protein
MRLLVCTCVLLSSAAAFAADSAYNGRWDITVKNEPHRRAWWLEVEGAGGAGIHGRFVGFPGGDMKTIQKLWIDSGVLKFTWDSPDGKTHLNYAARLVQGKLEGTVQPGQFGDQWTGVRAPAIDEKDGAAWKEGKPVEVFNGKDLAGWHGVMPGQSLGWAVENGILKSPGHANNLESDAKFWNFKLHVEYRLVAHSNSGIGLRGRYEVQILEDYGKQPDTHSNGSLYSRVAPRVNPSKPVGEWQTDDIRLVGRNLTVVVNGQEVVKTVVEGLTAMAVDAHEGQPGTIMLQGDHEAVEFRKVTLTPLTKK